MQGAGAGAERQLIVTRKGRPRKSGYRKPSGDLIKTAESTVSPIVVALRQPHRRFAPTDRADDARAETHLGQMNMDGSISNADYNAARRYARIVNRYRAVISSPNPNPPSIAGIMESRRGSSRDITDARERKAEYDAAFEALSNAGHTAARAVAHMAVYGQPCPYGAFEPMKRGLGLLREHFERVDNMTGGRNGLG